MAKKVSVFFGMELEGFKGDRWDLARINREFNLFRGKIFYDGSANPTNEVVTKKISIRKLKDLRNFIESYCKENSLNWFKEDYVYNGLHLHIGVNENIENKKLFLSSIFFNVPFLYNKVIYDSIGFILKGLSSVNDYSKIVLNRNIFKLNNYQLFYLLVVNKLKENNFKENKRNSKTYNFNNHYLDRYLDLNLKSLLRNFSYEIRSFHIKDLELISSKLELINKMIRKNIKLFNNYLSNRDKIINKFLKELKDEKRKIQKIKEEKIINVLDYFGYVYKYYEDIIKERKEKIVNNLDYNINNIKENKDKINLFDLVYYIINHKEKIIYDDHNLIKEIKNKKIEDAIRVLSFNENKILN